MGYWQEYYEKIPITEEEYYKNVYRAKDNSLIERTKELLSSIDNYRREAVWKYEGLCGLMREDNEILYYRYYKRGARHMTYFCGSEEYDKLKELEMFE